MNLSPFSGEQIVQVTNPDPFAKPVLRSPVLHTPVWMIATAQVFRLLWRLTRFLVRHPVLDLSAVVLVAGLARARLARFRGRRRCCCDRGRHLAAGVAVVLDPARRDSCPWPVPALALPPAVARRHDHLPARGRLPGPDPAARPRQGHLDWLHRPASCPAGVWPVRC